MRAVLEAPSGPSHSQRLTVASGADAVVGATGGPWNRRALEGLANEEDAEEFARVLDDAQRDLAKGAVASFYNLVDVVSSAREGFNNNPRHLLALLQRGATVSAYHAPADA